MAFDCDGEGMEECLAQVGLQHIGHIVRSWLGLQTGEPSLEPYRHDDGDHPQGDVRPRAIGAETLKQILDKLDPTDFADYQSYRPMLHAAHHATGGDKAAREVFLAWCSRNPDYGPGKRDQSGKPWAKSCAPCGIMQRSSGAPMRRTLPHHLRVAGHDGLADGVKRRVAFESDRQLLLARNSSSRN